MLQGSPLLTPARSGPFADPLGLLVAECGPVNLRTRNPFSVVSGAPLSVMTARGLALTAWRSRIERGVTSGALTTGDALFALVRVNTAATNGTIIAAAGPTYGFSLTINAGVFRMVAQFNSLVSTDSTTALVDGQIYSVFAFANGTGAANRYIFVDGVDDTNAGTSSGSSGLTTTHYGVTIGNTTANVASVPACDIIAAAAWRGRQFTASDAIAITLDHSLLFERRAPWVRLASGAGTITGDLAATESGSDTAAVTGSVLVAGILAGLESGSDTAALTGQIIVRGSLAATESGSDTASIIGAGSAPAITGNLAAVETGSDTAAGVGYVRINGVLSAVEVGSDTAAVAAPAARQPNSAPPVGQRLQAQGRPAVTSAARRMNTQAGRRPTYNGGTR